MDGVLLSCPECNKNIFVSNPTEGRLIICGCGAKLKLTCGRKNRKNRMSLIVEVLRVKWVKDVPATDMAGYTQLQIYYRVKVDKPIILNSERIWVNNNLISEHTYEPPQPVPVGEHENEYTQEFSVPVGSLPFSLFGHLWKIQWEYISDTESFKTTKRIRFFKPSEALASVGIGGLALGGLALSVVAYQKLRRS